MKLGLERSRAILERAGNPERGLTGALVAGTNGKGSTCAMLAAILRAAGHRVGTMPSPHLSSYTERIQVDGAPISEAEFAAALDWLRPRLEGITAELGPPTEFEILTTVAITYLARHCDRLAIEVGLGGRLDATNVLDLGVAVITNVALDHMQYLGDTVEKIATEKAGIIKLGNTVVTGATGPALDVIRTAAASRSARLWTLGGEISSKSRWASWRGSRLDVSGPGFDHRDLVIPLLGSFQSANAALAVAAAAALGVDAEEPVRQGLSQARSPGRLELVAERPALLLDGGHNPAALSQLAADVRRLAGDHRVGLVFGMMSDKDIKGALTELRRLQPARVVFTAAESPRAEPAEKLAAAWGGGAEVVVPAARAVEAALAAAGPEDLVLVSGSLYVVGEVRPRFVTAARR